MNTKVKEPTLDSSKVCETRALIRAAKACHASTGEIDKLLKVLKLDKAAINNL